MICKFCAKNSIFTNKVNKCSHCAGFVDSFGGCLPHHGRACIPKKNAMQLFNLWRLFCPEMQSCMERNCLCADIPIIFCDRNGRRRDTERYTGIHWDTRVSRCIPSPGYTGIHGDTRVSRCIPVYPRNACGLERRMGTTYKEASVELSKDDVLFFGRDSAGLALTRRAFFRFHRTTGGRISSGFQHSRVQTNAPDRSCANRLQQCLAAGVAAPRR